MRRNNTPNWHKRRKAMVDLSTGPIITQDQANRLYRDTQIGSPVDTVEELDLARNNLGPKDSLTELSDSNINPRRSLKDNPLNPLDDASTEENSERLFRPALRP